MLYEKGSPCRIPHRRRTSAPSSTPAGARVVRSGRRMEYCGASLDHAVDRSTPMKLIIQIPCFNEEQTLPVTLADLPLEVPGFAVVRSLLNSDGTFRTNTD